MEDKLQYRHDAGFEDPGIDTSVYYDNEFFSDVNKGLSSSAKYLPSKYFYDANGSKLFQKIMDLDEYYLTGCELEILEQFKNRLIDFFLRGCHGFKLIEFGAGDGLKTGILIDHLLKNNADFVYRPVDISQKAIDQLETRLMKDFPDLHIDSSNADYFQALEIVKNSHYDKKVILFLGSNLGNFTKQEAINFLSSIRQKMDKNDMLLLGLDMKKDPLIILNAYNDNSGITAKFNLNILRRINRELNANFITDRFYHYENYDPLSGETKSFIISKCDQVVKIKELGKSYVFTSGEAIFTELSQKYDMELISEISAKSGFDIKCNLFDPRKYFLNTIWQIK